MVFNSPRGQSRTPRGRVRPGPRPATATSSQHILSILLSCQILQSSIDNTQASSLKPREYRARGATGASRERRSPAASLYSGAMIMMPHIAPLPLSLRWMLSDKLYTTPTVLSSGEGLKKTNSVWVLSSSAPVLLPRLWGAPTGPGATPFYRIFRGNSC